MKTPKIILFFTTGKGLIITAVAFLITALTFTPHNIFDIIYSVVTAAVAVVSFWEFFTKKNKKQEESGTMVIMALIVWLITFVARLIFPILTLFLHMIVLFLIPIIFVYVLYLLFNKNSKLHKYN